MRILQGVLGLGRASHPAAVAAVTLLTALLALAVGRGWGSLTVAAAVGLGQLTIGWSNDWIDLPRDRALGRTRKPLVSGQVGGTVLVWGIGVAAVAHLALILLSGVPATMVLLGAEAVAMAYNLGLKDLPLSALAYAFAFGLAPSVVTLGLSPPQLPAVWATAAAALLGVSGHFTQVLGDIPEDRRLGSRGLPQLLGVRAAAGLAAAVLVAASLCVVLGAGLPPLAAGALLLIALVAAVGFLVCVGTSRQRYAFPITLVAVIAVTVGLLLGGSHIVQ